LPLEQKE